MIIEKNCNSNNLYELSVHFYYTHKQIYKQVWVYSCFFSSRLWLLLQLEVFEQYFPMFVIRFMPAYCRESRKEQDFFVGKLASSYLQQRQLKSLVSQQMTTERCRRTLLMEYTVCVIKSNACSCPCICMLIYCILMPLPFIRSRIDWIATVACTCSETIILKDWWDLGSQELCSYVSRMTFFNLRDKLYSVYDRNMVA